MDVLDTSRSFSVAAWVRFTPDGLWRTAMSQCGGVACAFSLQYDQSVDRWRMGLAGSDAASPAIYAAVSDAAPKPGVWTHLAGVYDAGTRRVQLYVNGKLQASQGVVPQSGMWAATSSLYIGDSPTARPIVGAVSEARIWNRVIDPGVDLEPLVEPVLVGQWEMEDFDDTTRLATDSSDYRNTAALNPGVSWCEGYNYSGGLCMDGTSGSADTAGPVLHTDQSFTVSAWLQQPSASDTALRIAVSQNDTVMHSMRIGYNGANGQYLFRVVRSNEPGAWGSTLYAQPAGTWVHVAGVWDAAAGEMRLYLNGARVAAYVMRDPPPFDATGPLTIGKNRVDGAWRDFWSGGIDRVRIWSGVKSDTEIEGLALEP